MNQSVTNESPGLQCVRRVAATFRANGINVEESRDGFVYHSSGGPTAVTVSSPATPSQVLEVIRVETTLPGEINDQTDFALSIVNRFAMLSAAVRGDERRMLALTTVPIIRGFENALAIDEHFVFAAALTQGASFGRAISQAFKGEETFDTLPGGERPGEWDSDDIRSAAEHFGNLDLADGLRLRAAIAWTTDRAATNEKNRYALVTIEPQRNPICGHGLSFRLDLPTMPDLATDTMLDSAEFPSLCRRLNRAEFASDLRQPLLGGWCASPIGVLSFAGFIPNMLYHPQHALRLATWLSWRSDWACAMLRNRD